MMGLGIEAPCRGLFRLASLLPLKKGRPGTITSQTNPGTLQKCFFGMDSRKA
jgi:hypothetical protein